MIHESSWPQMRGTGHAAVVLHRKCPVTKQMQPDRLGQRLKSADIEMRVFICHFLCSPDCFQNFAEVIRNIIKNWIWVSAFFMNNSI
jgi:hypothetical protein